MSEYPHIFLSYCRQDSDIMHRLRGELRAAGFSVWTDENLTPGTASWIAAIERAISRAGGLVIIMSPDAKWSEWVQSEISYAKVQRVRIFPVLARGDVREAVPIDLINVQWIDMRRGCDYAAALEGLIGALCEHLGMAGPPAQQAVITECPDERPTAAVEARPAGIAWRDIASRLSAFARSALTPKRSARQALTDRILRAVWFGMAALVLILLGVLLVERTPSLRWFGSDTGVKERRAIEPLEIARQSELAVSSLAWSPRDPLLVCGMSDGTVFVWNPQSGEYVHSTLKGHSQAVTSLAWSPDGTMVASASSGGRVLIWDAGTGERLYWFEEPRVKPSSVAWSPDSKHVVVGRSNGQVLVYNLTTVEVTWLAVHLHPVVSVAWSLDGALLASGGQDRTVLVWDAQTGERLNLLTGSIVSWSPGGPLLAAASHDMVLIWDALISKRLRSLKGHTADVLSLAWSPDGSLLATGSSDRTAVIWDVVTGQALYALEGYGGSVNGLAWSSDGSLLATGSGYELIVWEIR